MNDKSIISFLKKMKFIHSVKISRFVGLIFFIIGLMAFGLNVLSLRETGSFYFIFSIVGPWFAISGLAFTLFPAGKRTVLEYIEAEGKSNPDPDKVAKINKIVWTVSIVGSLVLSIWETLFLVTIVNTSFIYRYFIF